MFNEIRGKLNVFALLEATSLGVSEDFVDFDLDIDSWCQILGDTLLDRRP